VVKLEKAKGLFQDVCFLPLGHKASADLKVANITSEIAAIKGEAEIKECLQSWLDLSTNFTTFKNSRNADNLVNLKPMLERFASSQCPQAEQAHIMAGLLSII
jgi:hypothetical protein